MKKFNFKGRKHAVTATCLIVGMFVLTSAVYANYDDARGYTNYKDAFKDLVLYQDNFTADGEMSIAIDGEKIAVIKGTIKVDGDDYSLKTSSTEHFSENNDSYESLEVVKDSTKYVYDSKTNSYSQSEDVGHFRPDMNDPTLKKSIKFAELFADAMVGDLKNNFVLESKDKDNRTYSINVSGSQIPEVINAGISLIFTAANNQEYKDYTSVEFEDYQKAFAVFYEEQTGKKSKEDISAWNEETEKFNEQFYKKYEDIRAAKGDTGIVYVKADGTYEYYKTYDEYSKNVQKVEFSGNDIMKTLGTEPYIDNAACKFTLDKDGKIIFDESEASMLCVDSNGKNHKITIKGNYKVSDYGTTKVEDFDTSGKTKN